MSIYISISACTSKNRIPPHNIISSEGALIAIVPYDYTLQGHLLKTHRSLIPESVCLFNIYSNDPLPTRFVLSNHNVIKKWNENLLPE